MPLTLPYMPGFILHAEWIALSLYQTVLGGQCQDHGGTPQPLPKCERYGSRVPAGRINT